MSKIRKMSAMLAAGTVLCGGFVNAAEEPKAAEAAKPAAPAAPAAEVAKPVDIFASIPAVVAEIGDKKITKDEVVADIMKMFPDGKIPEQITAAQITQALPGIVKQVVLQKLFETELAKAGIKPSAEMVKEKLTAEFKKMDKQMLDLMTQQLAMQGKTPEAYIDEMAQNPQIQQQMASQIYLEKNVLNNVKVDTAVSPEAVKKFYDENLDKFKEEADKPDQIRASHILIGVDKGASEADQKKALDKANELLAQLKKDPKLFEELAKDNSSCPSKERGGSLGRFEKGQMVPDFEKAALALKPGDLSAEPVKTEYGYHIIRRDMPQGDNTASFDSVKSEIEAFLKQQKVMEEKQLQQKAMMEYFQKLETENKVKYLIPMPEDLMK